MNASDEIFLQDNAQEILEQYEKLEYVKSPFETRCMRFAKLFIETTK